MSKTEKKSKQTNMTTSYDKNMADSFVTYLVCKTADFAELIGIKLLHISLSFSDKETEVAKRQFF